MEGLIGAILGILASGVVSYFLQRALFKNQFEMQKRQFNHDIEMFAMNNKRKEMVKKRLEELLQHKSYTDRSFKVLKAKLIGFDENEIRQLLHEIEATSYVRENNEEWWYLKSRAQERIDKKETAKSK